MQQNRMYHDLAHLWPVVSPPEEYAVEAWHLREVIHNRLGPGSHTLLELGVGGGHILSHLTSDFQAVAVDLSENMLSLSRELNPGVAHHLGDMRSVRLAQTFDVVLIHDAINYMLTESDLQAAFETARAHLRPGGVLVTAPDM
ncbi:MAG TPA: class I SAM-dependent methyltransferase, partial [Dehalococcoidia bacterium]|nr:class I SAM-dependent methyltransferase [Dehalococcoidia bacterium]